jgi:2-oxoglutarate dehydrogenase E1 component
VLADPDDAEPSRARRILLCTGKIFYELLIGRRERNIDDIAIVRVEQLYPFPAAEIRTALQGYPSAREVFWVQEEPWNMGSWHFVYHRLKPLLGESQTLTYVGRDEAASPAIGSYKLHQKEQTEVIDRALRKSL